MNNGRTINCVHDRFRRVYVGALLYLAGLTIAAAGQGRGLTPGLPHLEKHENSTQLIVDDKPFLVLGGELHNSSSSSPEYMTSIWSRLSATHINTVLLPVAWETIEPEEGKFDFHCVDGLLKGARENKIKIVVLWFGSWKNTYSSYVPAWVKGDSERFPRVQTSDGRGTERISTFSAAARDADARAFARLMQHLREADGAQHTVLMVQVENEVGVIPESRDHSTIANAAFAGPVPASLTSFLRLHLASMNSELRKAWEVNGERMQGSWQQVFGTGSLTDDLFMAWHYAMFVEHVTAAGKAEYPLPMFANAALIRPNYEPGQYNSGGPLPHSKDIWHAGAPSLDFLSPDIYFNDFVRWAGAYSLADNPLFIPETQGGSVGAANALYAIGQLNAFGFSPFGIDDEANTPLDLVGIPNAVDSQDSSAIGDVYKLLAHTAPMILKAQKEEGLHAVLIEGDAQRSARLSVGEYTATMTRVGSTPGAASRLAALFLQTGKDEFLVVGCGESQITFSSDKPGLPIVGIESIDEEFFEDGMWVLRRRLNGDEDSQGQALRVHASDLGQGRIYRVRLYRYR